MTLRSTARDPLHGMRKIDTGASSPGTGLVTSLADWILECEEHTF